MHKHNAILGMLLFSAGLLVAPAVGRAQYIGALPQPGIPAAYQAMPAPTVSPYLNLLAPNQFVVTNYQTLVRPLIDERDNAARQASTIQTLQQTQARLARTTAPGKRSQEDRPAPTSRFLNYSHYYGDFRR